MAQQKFQIDRELYPFTSRFMAMEDGAQLHYIDEGAGEQTFLMLHGNPTWSFVYRKLVAGLSPDHRCVAPDYPGFGLSTAPAGFDFRAKSQYDVIEEFFQRLDLDNVILVMQDWGGPIGFALAARFPEHIKGVVIGNTWAWPLRDDRRFRRFSGIMGGPFGRWMARRFNGVWRFFMLRGFHHSISHEEMEMYAAPFATRDNRLQTSIFPRELVQAVELENQAAQGLANIHDKPALLLWGTEDFGFQEKERMRFEAALTEHQTVLLDASHFWQDEQGARAVEEIERWLGHWTSRPATNANQNLSHRTQRTPAPSVEHTLPMSA